MALFALISAMSSSWRAVITRGWQGMSEEKRLNKGGESEESGGTPSAIAQAPGDLLVNFDLKRAVREEQLVDVDEVTRKQRSE